MYVNIAVLKETQPHERRVALVPSVVAKLTKLGGRLHMQSGAGNAIHLPTPPMMASSSSMTEGLWSPTPTWFSPSSRRRWPSSTP